MIKASQAGEKRLTVEE